MKIYQEGNTQITEGTPEELAEFSQLMAKDFKDVVTKIFKNAVTENPAWQIMLQGRIVEIVHTGKPLNEIYIEGENNSGFVRIPVHCTIDYFRNFYVDDEIRIIAEIIKTPGYLNKDFVFRLKEILEHKRDGKEVKYNAI